MSVNFLREITRITDITAAKKKREELEQLIRDCCLLTNELPAYTEEYVQDSLRRNAHCLDAAIRCFKDVKERL